MTTPSSIIQLGNMQHSIGAESEENPIGSKSFLQRDGLFFHMDSQLPCKCHRLLSRDPVEATIRDGGGDQTIFFDDKTIGATHLGKIPFFIENHGIIQPKLEGLPLDLNLHPLVASFHRYVGERGRHADAGDR